MVLLGLVVSVLGCPAPPAKKEVATPTPVDKDEPEAQADPLRHDGEAHLANIIQLTRDTGENAEAYWSFDDTQLIFQTKRPPYACDQIFRMPADGSGEATLLSTGKGRTTCAYFLPGNTEIVYSSTHERATECPPEPDFSKGYVWALYDYDVYRASADGSDLRKLTNRAGYDAEATVCAQDGTILFTSDRDGDLELYRMDPEGKNVVRLTNTPGYDGGAFFSQDCSQIVWRASRPEGAELEEFRALLKQKLVRPSKLEIFVANADGSNVRQLTYLNAASFAPYFHPSGQRVLFSTNYGDPRGREFDIHAINTDGTQLERITFAPGFDGFPMFSFDGTRLAFASNRNQAKDQETDVYVARWVEGQPQNIIETAADRFRANVAWLADDARQGRGVGTRGLDESADWLAGKFRAYGAAGAADAKGGYKQKFEMPVALRRDPGTTLTIDGEAVTAEAFVPTWFSARGEVSAPVVFASYGVDAKELKVNDYRRVNARGKIVVVRRFTPTNKPYDKRDAQRRYGDIQYKAFVARKRGAVGLIVVDLPAKGESEQPDAEFPKLVPEGSGDSGIPVVVVSREVGAKLARGRHNAKIAVAMTVENKPVYNVVAKISAGAKNRRPGAVVIGAHYDHLGQSHPGSLEGGKKVIHNGADDNASGTAGLLEIARTLAEKQAELTRDVYLVAFTAEESGLVGSQHFVDHLPDGLKAGDIVAMLNMDMIGRMRDNKLSVIGTQSAREWAGVMGPLCQEVRVRCEMGGDGYGPSDQTAFYAKGVPVLHFFTGGHLEYHRGSDDTALINAGGGARVAELVSHAAIATANRAERLTYQQARPPPPRGDVRVSGGSLGTIPVYGGEDNIPGCLLADVRPGSPAAKAGLRGGDRIVRMGKDEVRNVRDLFYVLLQASPGEKVKITVLRDGKEVTVQAVYGQPTRRGPASNR